MSKLEQAKEYLKKVLSDPEFISKVQHTKFTYTDKTSNEVAQDIASINIDDFVIKMWRPSWYSLYKNSVVAYTKGKYVNINVNFYSRESYTYKHLAGSICHEISHMPPYNYAHPKRHTITRPDSVPYRVGVMVEEWG